MTVAGVRVLSGVPYAAVPGMRPLELDLYLPPQSGGPVPVVVFVHGGGWRMGSRRSLGPAYAGFDPSPFEQVAAGGIAVASVDYRLSGEGTWPTQLHDAKAAVRWLRSRAADAGLDADKIAAWGESAGGHLALLLGLTGPDLDGEVGVLGPSSAVSAVAAWYPPSDLPALPDDLGTDPADPDTREAQLLGAPLSEAADRWRQASPLSYVRAATAPILILHGENDRLIPCVQSKRLAAALADAGATVDLSVHPGADHMWLGSPDVADLALHVTSDYLRGQLGSASG